VNSQVWWFVARSSGIIAWALLTLSVCWGLLLSTRLLARRVSPAWLLDLHRHLGGLAVVFTGVHLIGLVADSYVTFGWAELFIPMASSWKPGAVAFGIVAFYLLLAVEITSLAMRRLPRSLWRWVHRSSFALFGFATYHGIAAGTDAGNVWYRIVTWTSIGVVVSLTLVLVVTARRTRTRLASLPPAMVLSEELLVGSSSAQPIEVLPAPVLLPAAMLPPPVAPRTVRPTPVPFVPAPAVLAPSMSPTSMPPAPFAEISQLGSVAPFVPAAPIGPPVAAGASSLSAARAAVLMPPPVVGSPVSRPALPTAPELAPPAWLAPDGLPIVPADDRELVIAGRGGADAGGPPTTAT
jgi:hypothetical protein